MSLHARTQAILLELTGRSRVRSGPDSHTIITTFLQNNMGDPIEVRASGAHGRFSIDDGGAIAGILFSTGNDGENTPQRRLLEALARVYGARLDFDQGTVAIDTDEQRLLDSVLYMTNLVTTMLTASPHLPAEAPHQK